MCGLCGSADHFTHNCDNDEAKATARGQCFRCKKDGHTKMSCIAERCSECGEFGHKIFNCQAPRSISTQKKLRIQREEADFKQAQRQLAERRRQSQLGDHDRKVPVIQATTTTGNPVENPGGKRKRPDSSGPEGLKASRPRTENKPPANAPKGSRAPAAPTVSYSEMNGGFFVSLLTLTRLKGLIKPSRDGPAYPSTNKPPPTAPTPIAPSGPKAMTVSSSLFDAQIDQSPNLLSRFI